MELLIKSWNGYRPIRFLVVGVASVMVHIFVAYLYIYFIDRDSVIGSNVLGFSVAVVFSYILQTKVVFRKDISYESAFKYIGVQIVGVTISILVTNYLLFGSPYLKVLFVVVLLPMMTYTIHTLWTYKETSFI
jgi:putative flippase GtrA